MKIPSIFSFLVILPAFAQTDRMPDVSTTDLIILFSVAVAVVIGLFVYLLRYSVLQKKTLYDKKDYSSKKDHDYEKYHSEWTGDDSDFGKRSIKDEEFRKSLEESSSPDYYALLEVPKNASQDEIKKQFRRLVKELHPDRNKDESTKSKMIEINKAYEILSDKEKKEHYDKYYNAS